jgi:hypothetical protein
LVLSLTTADTIRGGHLTPIPDGELHRCRTPGALARPDNEPQLRVRASVYRRDLGVLVDGRNAAVVSIPLKPTVTRERIDLDAESMDSRGGYFATPDILQLHEADGLEPAESARETRLCSASELGDLGDLSLSCLPCGSMDQRNRCCVRKLRAEMA